MYEKNYQVVITDGNESISHPVCVFYDNEVDSTILNIKAICIAIQVLLYQALQMHDWYHVQLAESALESIESVNYKVEDDTITVYA